MVDIKTPEEQITRLEKRLARQVRAREEAERLLEEKSREIYEINQRLHDHARLLEATVINAKDGVLITTAELENGGPEIIYVNKAVSNITGYSADEIIGSTPRMFQGVDTDRAVLDELKTRLREGRSFQGELRNYSKNGKGYWLDISIVPVKNDDGQVTHFAAIERDITDRKAFEKELKHEKERAEAANIAKSDFLATMSHELRTPMNGIVGLSELLLGLDLDEDGRENVYTINASAQGLLELINDILDFSKIEAGELELEPHDFDLCGLVEKHTGLLRHMAEEKGLLFNLDLMPGLPAHIFADSLRLRQVITNLVGNAIKFTERGSIYFAVEPVPRDQPTHIKFTVADTGIGIPGDKLGMIFNKFETIEGRNFGGTGLGLAISQRLVRMMGGDIHVSSVLGEGTKFSFMIEAQLDRLRHDQQEPGIEGGLAMETTDPVPLKDMRLLSVDDHPVNLMMMKKLLRKLGAAEIVNAAEGREAVQAFEKSLAQGTPFDGIIMDYYMPEMDGVEATKAIRQMEAQQAVEAAVPIIAITADAMKETHEKCLAAGMNDYLTKPVMSEQLVETLLRHID